MFIHYDIQTVDDIQKFIDVAVTLWQSPLDIAVKVSLACSMRRVTEVTFMTPHSAPILIDVVKVSL